MGKSNFISISCFLLSIFSVEFLQAQQEIKPCQKEPPFIKTLGFDPLWTGFSTVEKKTMGIVLVEFERKIGQSVPTSSSIRKSYYQHPSWETAGYLSTISFDIRGNTYAIPAPLISMFYNDANKLNTIYQIDANTGIMNAWLNLPFHTKPSVNNPYGLLGITYDCTADIIVAASVAGSDRYHERGMIYLIQSSTKKIVDTLKGIDVMGLAVAIDEQNRKRLYFAKTRNGSIYSAVINKLGKLIRKSLREELSLDGYGPRGDDKARKIRFIGNQLQINGVAFNYNLQAQREKPETIYTFNWDAKTKKWVLINFQ